MKIFEERLASGLNCMITLNGILLTVAVRYEDGNKLMGKELTIAVGEFTYDRVRSFIAEAESEIPGL